MMVKAGSCRHISTYLFSIWSGCLVHFRIGHVIQVGVIAKTCTAPKSTHLGVIQRWMNIWRDLCGQWMEHYQLPRAFSSGCDNISSKLPIASRSSISVCRKSTASFTRSNRKVAWSIFLCSAASCFLQKYDFPNRVRYFDFLPHIRRVNLSQGGRAGCSVGRP